MSERNPDGTAESGKPDDSAGTSGAEKGWGYVIVLSNFFVMLFVFGMMQSQSFFFVEWQEYFEVPAAEVSFLTSLSMLLLGILSPFAGMLATVFGSRIIVMIGGAFVSLGMMLSTFFDTISGLNLTWGVVTGFGFALIYSPSVAMLGQYFKRYFTTANSIMLTGGSVGMIIAPFLTEGLINAYGWRGAMLIWSAVTCNLIALGATLRPIYGTNTPQNEPLPQPDSSPTNENREENIFTVIFIIILELACNVRYMIVLLVFLLMGLVLLAPNIHVIARASEAGIPRYLASFLPTIIGIGNLFGRLSGFLIDKLQVSQDAANVVSFLICSITYFVNPFCNSFWSQVLYSVVFGFGQGAVVVFSFVLAQQLIPNKHRAVGVGFVTLCLFAGYTIGIVLVGWLYDVSGGYDIPFYVMGVLTMVCTSLIVIVAILNRRSSR